MKHDKNVQKLVAFFEGFLILFERYFMECVIICRIVYQCIGEGVTFISPAENHSYMT